MSVFKNALCLAQIPEGKYGARVHLSPRNARCQRKRGHKGPHRSWSRTWETSDEESILRETVEADNAG